MTCAELLQAVDPYLDDELSVLEVLRVQAHVLRCAPCRMAMASEARLHALLEADALQDQPSPALRGLILQRLATVSPEPSLPRRRRQSAVPYAILASGLLFIGLLAGVMVVRFPGASNLPPVMEEVAAKHRLYAEAAGPALDLKTADVGELTAWLRGRLGFPVKAPAEHRPGERLIGGRVSSLADVPAAYLAYERDNHPVSLFITQRLSPGLPEEHKWIVEGVELYTSRVHGLTLVWWEDNDLVYAAASTTSSRDLAEFALLCIRSRRSASWIFYSAGRRAIERARVALGLGQVLSRFGNISSATVLFVLDQVLRSGRADPGEWGIVIALSQGFAAEGAGLWWDRLRGARA